MEVEFISDKDCIWVVLSGEIDEYGAKTVRASIDDVIEKTNAVIADKKAQLETLEEYKKSLIFEYVTGKKEVPVS